jgi:uncharacterized protein
MFLVGGGILVHGVPPVDHAIEHWAEAAGGLKALVTVLLDGLVGVVAGAAVLGAVTLGQRMTGRKATA